MVHRTAVHFMADSPKQDSQRERRLGGLSLICLALGIFGPFLSALNLGLVNAPPRAGVNLGVLAFGVGGAFMLLALMLGILSRRSRAGRIGLLGSAVLLSVVVVSSIFLVSRPAATPVSLPIPAPIR